MSILVVPKSLDNKQQVRVVQKLIIVADGNDPLYSGEGLLDLELAWQIQIAGTLEEAELILQTQQVEAILVDLDYAGIDALEVISSLSDRYSHIPIIALSAPYGVSLAIQAMSHGAENHFPRELLNREPQAVLDALDEAKKHYQDSATVQALTDTIRMEFTLGANPKQIPALVAYLADQCIRIGLVNRHCAKRIRIALEEALLNAVIHGNLEVSSDLRQIDEKNYYSEIARKQTLVPYRDRKTLIQVSLSKEEAVFEIEDEGPGFDYKNLPDPFDPENLMRVGGKGLLMMRSFMSEVNHEGRGNRIVMVKRKDK